MSNAEKIRIIENSPIIGYWSCLGGVEVRFIDYTADGIMFYVKANAWNGKPSYHIRKVKEQWENGDRHKDHIVIYNQRLYLDECLRA